MKKILLFALIASLSFTVACNKDDDDSVEFDYHVHITSPTNEDKNHNDELSIVINFESHSGETIHHVKVRIYNKADNTEIYNKPTDAHVHEQSGTYSFSDSFNLTSDNGVEPHTDWILEAKVWGHEDGLAEVVETVEFHVHPE